MNFVDREGNISRVILRYDPVTNTIHHPIEPTPVSPSVTVELPVRSPVQPPPQVSFLMQVPSQNTYGHVTINMSSDYQPLPPQPSPPPSVSINIPWNYQPSPPKSSPQPSPPPSVSINIPSSQNSSNWLKNLVGH